MNASAILPYELIENPEKSGNHEDSYSGMKFIDKMAPIFASYPSILA